MGRPETGPMQFGDDWPGVFIRGDNALGYALALDAALLNTRQGTTLDVMALATIDGLSRTLKGCDIREQPTPTRALLVQDMEPPASFRVRYQQRGEHVHCRMFQRRPPDQTWAKNGDLVFDLYSWSAMRVIMALAGFDVLPEEHT